MRSYPGKLLPPSSLVRVREQAPRLEGWWTFEGIRREEEHDDHGAPWLRLQQHHESPRTKAAPWARDGFYHLVGPPVPREPPSRSTNTYGSPRPGNRMSKPGDTAILQSPGWWRTARGHREGTARRAPHRVHRVESPGRWTGPGQAAGAIGSPWDRHQTPASPHGPCAQAHLTAGETEAHHRVWPQPWWKDKRSWRERGGR